MEILLGHLAGDYLLQWHSMANAKKSKGWYGFWNCFLHCLLYTLAVVLFVQCFLWWKIILVFLSHWVVDRYYWLSYIHGTIMKRPTVCSGSALGTFCYIAMDNTVHLIFLYFILK